MSKFVQLSFPQGDDKTYKFYVKDKDGNPINLIGATLESQIRKDYNGDVVATFDCELVDPYNGTFTAKMDNETSSSLPIKGSKTRFVFDIELTYSNGDKTKIVYGNLVITREVTR